MTRQLQIAVRAARAAGRVLRQKYDETREIQSKGKRDIVTDADFAADRTVREILHTAAPDDRMLSEEADTASRQALWDAADRDSALGLWIVDPLDGTTNYAHHLPTFCVSVALYRAGAVQVGAIFDPLRNELFTAERGRGAAANGRPICVSSVRRVADAVVGMEWSRAQPLRKRAAEILTRVVLRCTTTRTNGSAALSLCYVAAGRLDAYFHPSLAPWDVAAGALIAEEAGARVTDLAGKPWSVHSQSYLLANSHLHPALLKLCRNRNAQPTS